MGRRPSNLPQKSNSQKQPSQQPIQSRIAPTRPSIFSKIFPKVQKPAAKPAPQKPQTFFGTKKDWTRQDFMRQVTKNPLSFGGKGYSQFERKKMLEKTFSPGRYGGYVSESETKRGLRELRRQEYQAKTGAEKSKLSNIRKYIEKQTDLHGKY
jgi:hypothetical protein